jgi:hypothetical protein
MTLGAAADHRLADLVHLDGGLHAGRHAELLQRVLHGQSVHHRGQHAHIIGLGAVHALGSAGHTAEDVAAADDEADFQPGLFAAFTSRASSVTKPGSMPKACSPIRTSPDNLRRTRL